MWKVGFKEGQSPLVYLVLSVVIPFSLETWEVYPNIYKNNDTAEGSWVAQKNQFDWTRFLKKMEVNKYVFAYILE